MICYDCGRKNGTHRGDCLEVDIIQEEFNRSKKAWDEFIADINEPKPIRKIGIVIK